ncbi:MAG TPA: hypothetical protein VMN56_02485 [Casimicrobiaceae bacterium]|nr:hypothetical protein [Casimicrobiaceae bacterium]
MFAAPFPSATRDLNARTDRAFFARHPERAGIPLGRNEPALVREWKAIREALARQSYARPPWTPPSVAAVGGACPPEDPFPAALRTPGRPCASGGRRCWPNEGWRDIADADMPCSNAARRNPATYDAILDYFNVAHPGNARYARTPKDTYCNIYVHDVTRAMGASIPHWVRDPAQTAHKPLGWRELGANATCDWLNAVGRPSGWLLVDGAMLDAVARLRAAPGGPLAVGLTPGVARAIARVAASAHPDPRLLRQDAYIAQQLANQGLPVVISWKASAGPGHVAMVRPETATAHGRVHVSGLFIPRSAQAGAENYESKPAAWIAMDRYRTRQLWVHD